MPYGITRCYLPPDRGENSAFTPAEADTWLSDPGGMQGWVALCYMKADRPGIEPVTCKSQVQRPTAKPPLITCILCWCLQERLALIEQELRADDEQRHLEARNKVRRIETAEQRKHAPVNDSEMVDEMFGFIDSQVDGASEAGAPLAFKVRLMWLT